MQHSTLSPRPAAGESEFVTAKPIDIASLLERVHHPTAGGIVLFSGEVRDHNEGKKVKFLEYEAYGTMAGKLIGDIVNEAIHQWDLKRAIAVHRTGRLELTESAVVVITAHAHRKEAYDANRYIIDRIKEEVPIWKCEHYDDGTHEWIHHC